MQLNLWFKKQRLRIRQTKVEIRAKTKTTTNAIMSTEKSKEIFNVLALCIIWYIVSSSNNVIGKMVLSTFPYPMTVTMVQLTSITLYSGPFFNLWGVRKYSNISWNYYFKMIIPLALGKFFSSVTSHISIWKVPVSYAHTGRYLSNSISNEFVIWLYWLLLLKQWQHQFSFSRMYLNQRSRIESFEHAERQHTNVLCKDKYLNSNM